MKIFILYTQNEHCLKESIKKDKCYQQKEEEKIYKAIMCINQKSYPIT